MVTVGSEQRFGSGPFLDWADFLGKLKLKIDDRIPYPVRKFRVRPKRSGSATVLSENPTVAHPQ